MYDISIYYLLISFFMILLGLAIRRYLKSAELDNLNKVLGLGVYFLKFYANALLIFGIIAFTTLGIAIVLHFLSEYFI